VKGKGYCEGEGKRRGVEQGEGRNMRKQVWCGDTNVKPLPPLKKKEQSFQCH